METKNVFSWKSLSFLVLSLFLVVIIQGCGGGGGSSSSPSASGESIKSQAIIGLTDAAGDFKRYEVKVTALDLYKADGSVVHTLPTGGATEVDFAQLTAITEFLTAGTVPVGHYTKVVMTLDYSDADIEVDGGTGDAIGVSNIYKEDGTPLTSTLDLTVELDKDYNTDFTVAAGVPSHLALDFDLGATNKVIVSGSTASLYVSPCLKASLVPDTFKSQRFRGPLQSVNVSGKSFVMILRPFANALSHDASFGTMTVLVDDNTVYNINGTIEPNAAAGLTALSQLPQYTGVIVHGKFDSSFNFTATEVIAGKCVPGGTLDCAIGTVTGVSGTTLTIKGATVLRSTGQFAFNDTVTVLTADPGTKVCRQFSKESFTMADVMVGQRVEAFGNLSGSTIDATSGYVRMVLTTILGTANSASITSSNLFTVPLNLQKIDGRGISLFTFAGVNPAAYTVEGPSSLLDGSSIPQNAPVRIKGFPLRYGVDEADFYAVTDVDLSDADAFLNVGWGTGAAYGNVLSAFSLLSGNLILKMDSVGFFHRVNREGDITEFGSEDLPVIQSASTCRFRIDQEEDEPVIDNTFSSFIIDLFARVATHGAMIKHIYAWGTFNDSTKIFTATYIRIKLG